MEDPIVLVVIFEDSEQAERTLLSLQDAAIHAVTMSFVLEESLDRSVREHIADAQCLLGEGKSREPDLASAETQKVCCLIQIIEKISAGVSECSVNCSASAERKGSTARVTVSLRHEPEETRMGQANSVVCICETSQQAQHAIHDLQGVGVDMRTLSTATIDRPSEEYGTDSYAAGDETFNIPGLGALLVNGPLASWIVTAFENGAGGGDVSIVGAALTTLGIPHDCILQYQAALRADRRLLIVHGHPNDVATAHQVMGGTTHSCHTIHGETIFDTGHRASALGASTYAYQS